MDAARFESDPTCDLLVTFQAPLELIDSRFGSAENDDLLRRLVVVGDLFEELREFLILGVIVI